jgi:hypothetical protein
MPPTGVKRKNLTGTLKASFTERQRIAGHVSRRNAFTVSI